MSFWEGWSDGKKWIMGITASILIATILTISKTLFDYQSGSTNPDMMQTKEGSKIQVVTEERSYSHTGIWNDPNKPTEYTNQYRFPRVSGMTDRKIQFKVNLILKNHALYYEKNFEEGYVNTVSYEIIANQYDVLSIYFRESGIYLGATVSNDNSSSLNIDLKNGKRIYLKDLLKPGAIALIQNKIADTCLAEEVNDFFDISGFFVLNEKLTLIFSSGCYAGTGTLKWDIDLDELIPFAKRDGLLAFIIEDI